MFFIVTENENLEQKAESGPTVHSKLMAARGGPDGDAKSFHHSPALFWEYHYWRQIKDKEPHFKMQFTPEMFCEADSLNSFCLIFCGRRISTKEEAIDGRWNHFSDLLSSFWASLVLSQN
jgi:hypothetical protein